MTVVEAQAEDIARIDGALRFWRQGDVTLDAGLEFLHFADLSQPLSEAARKASNDRNEQHECSVPGSTALVDDVPGLVVLSQTCDIVRTCKLRPYVEVSPLVPIHDVEAVRRLKRPAFGYVPATAERNLVADLDRTMTVEKSIVAGWNRVCGCSTDEEARDFALALGRKRTRFAFPEHFVQACRKLQDRLLEKGGRQTSEGAHIRALREIRVRAAPSWEDERITLTFWFIKEHDPEGCEPNWAEWAEKWIALFDQSAQLNVDGHFVCGLSYMTARDYVESDQLDLEQLSSTR